MILYSNITIITLKECIINYLIDVVMQWNHRIFLKIFLKKRKIVLNNTVFIYFYYIVFYIDYLVKNNCMSKSK